MKLNISLLNVQPMSLNQAYSTDKRTNRRFKSKQYTQFTSIIGGQLRNYKGQITKFNNKYSIEDHYIVATYRFYYPIFVKAGNKISKTSKDLSNSIKTLEDILFSQLIADDSQVINLNVTKIHSQDIRIEVELELKNIKHIL